MAPAGDRLPSAEATSGLPVRVRRQGDFRHESQPGADARIARKPSNDSDAVAAEVDPPGRRSFL